MFYVPIRMDLSIVAAHVARSKTYPKTLDSRIGSASGSPTNSCHGCSVHLHYGGVGWVTVGAWMSQWMVWDNRWWAGRPVVFLSQLVAQIAPDSWSDHKEQDGYPQPVQPGGQGGYQGGAHLGWNCECLWCGRWAPGSTGHLESHLQGPRRRGAEMLQAGRMLQSFQSFARVPDLFASGCSLVEFIATSEVVKTRVWTSFEIKNTQKWRQDSTDKYDKPLNGLWFQHQNSEDLGNNEINWPWNDQLNKRRVGRFPGALSKLSGDLNWGASDVVMRFPKPPGTIPGMR